MQPSKMVIQPARCISGSLRLPGDKSISHRYAMLAALAEGTSSFSNFSTGADCTSTLDCLRALGAVITKNEDGSVAVKGRGRALAGPAGALDCGNSGSTMRMLAGILAGQELTCELTGDESLSRRPMARIIEPLARMGARIEAHDLVRPPLHIEGTGALRAIDYKIPVASAQVKTAILFAGLLASGETSVEEPVRTRDHGELALRAFGAEVKRAGKRASIKGRQELRAIEGQVPGDISSAAFFMCAAALFPGSNLILDDVLLNPSRASLLDVLRELGARIRVLNVEERHGELVGTIQVEHGVLRGAKISGAQSAALIDELPVLSAIAPYTREGIELRDAAELRVKESDRIAVVARNLRAMGAEVQEHDDGLTIPGKQEMHGAEIDSAGDHRIAMAFSVAALRAKGESHISGTEAARISYPNFFDALERLVQR
jgi:3-phosphoshikimate 1-carboxyvinyltransferase